MQLPDHLDQKLDTATLECWQQERKRVSTLEYSNLSVQFGA
jgi:hypothetical protein